MGRLLSQIGSGFTLFYAPIFFVNQVGLSATAVGIGLGSGSISGVVGRFLGVLLPTLNSGGAGGRYCSLCGFCCGFRCVGINLQLSHPLLWVTCSWVWDWSLLACNRSSCSRFDDD
jgi:hypothetical protein